MAIKLAKGEQVVRQYDYATERRLFKKTNKALIITNKRIIQMCSSTGRGTASFSNYEIPVEKSKYVNVSFGKKSRTSLLVIGIISIILSVACLIMSIIMEKFQPVMLILAAVGVLCIWLYIKKKIFYIACNISAEGRMFSVLSLGVATFSRFLGKSGPGKEFVLKITVDDGVAMNMAQELGAVIKEVQDGVYDIDIHGEREK